MSSISLIVKGTPEQAAAAARTAGVIGFHISNVFDDFIQVGGTCPATSENEDAVMRWFCLDASMTVPYPVGSCLHYSLPR
jgi:hypothetical protein